MPAVDLVARMADRQLSPIDVADAFLDQAERLNQKLLAFCALDAEQVRSQAREAERALSGGEPLGRLHGLPVAVKDLIFTKDLPTVGGSKLYERFVPDEDDVVVERLRAAGAIILGKTNVPEFGYSLTTANDVFGTTRNPWNLQRTPGGSSGGSAVAIAGGMAPAALGSDGGGSIRIPSSFCGIYGLKPSFGRVPLYPGCRDSRYPGFSGWESVEHIGPMTRTVADAALLLDVVAGSDPRDRHSISSPDYRYLDIVQGEPQMAGVRIGWTADWGGRVRVDNDVRNLVTRAALQFEELGATVQEASPDFRFEDYSSVFEATISLESDPSGMREMVRNSPGVPINPRITDMLSKEWSFQDLADAIVARKKLHSLIWRFFSQYDLLLTPVAPLPAFDLKLRASDVSIGGERVTDARTLSCFAFALNLTGNPAASVPCGMTPDGLPVGLQIVGNHLNDRLVLAASRAFEVAAPWSGRWPPEV